MITPEILYGIEIKSDADTYTRLAKQVKYYNWYYDRNIIVVGTSHAMHVAEHVPDWWGIITVEPDANGDADFYVLREAGVNPRVKDKRKITILWRTELNHLLEILWPQAYEELFERDYNTIAQEIEEYRSR